MQLNPSTDICISLWLGTRGMPAPMQPNGYSTREVASWVGYYNNVSKHLVWTSQRMCSASPSQYARKQFLRNPFRVTSKAGGEGSYRFEVFRFQEASTRKVRENKTKQKPSSLFPCEWFPITVKRHPPLGPSPHPQAIAKTSVEV